MIRFECDYAEGMHKRILDKMVETNMEQTAGYSEDPHSERARNLIKDLCGNEKAAVHLLVGGTQTNQTVIASVLRPYQGVVCATTGHLNTHETGAIEATGHKVMTVPSDDGKITPDQIKAVYDEHWDAWNHEHMVQPGMVYISQPTENGTTYTKAELTALSRVCRECELPLYVDGARMGYAIMSEGNDISLRDLAQLADIFYIGGTKVGAMMGEAVVICDPALQRDFRYNIKQRGGMFAKGRLLGIQFEVLMEDGLYFEISKHADDLAMKIRRAFEAAGFSMRYDSVTNQQFPILPNDLIKKLEEKYTFAFWEKADETHTVVRFCTSWATQAENVDELVEDIKKLTK